MDYRMLAASLAASLAAATSAMAAPPENARIVSQYSSWAGNRSNAEALVTGLRNGSSITIATTSSDHSVSLAGFTPAGTMSPENVDRALDNARRSLARVGIQHPNANQIQAALIGGEVELPSGKTQELHGVVAARGGNPTVAAR